MYPRTHGLNSSANSVERESEREIQTLDLIRSLFDQGINQSDPSLSLSLTLQAGVE